jgi:hypothetical protein
MLVEKMAALEAENAALKAQLSARDMPQKAP